MLRSLFIIGLLISICALAPDQVGNIIGPVEYKGVIVFDYPFGDNPINNIIINPDPILANNLIIVSVPSTWTYSYSGGILTLSGGLLSPSDYIQVTVSLNKYFEAGEYQANGVGTTTNGETSLSSGVLLVGQLNLLYTIGLASNNLIPLLLGTFALGLLDVFLSKRRILEGSGTSVPTGDGDDPRDVPPPVMFGEEIDVDPKVPPVYVISDFHIGSNKGVDKSKSNDMDSETLKIFLKWLDSVDLDAVLFDHYDVVMNGDFLDLWQAKRPKDDTNENRLSDVLDSNNVFFSELAQILRRRYPRCRFYYLIGNHDDALFSSNDGSHSKARMSVKNTLRKTGDSPISFNFDKTYSNSAYKLHIEHGHRFDSYNWKEKNDKAVGQDIAEYINRMQELDPVFQNGEYTPNQEFVKHLVCLKKNKKTPKKVLDIIDKMESIAMKTSLKNSFWGAIGDGIDYLLRGDRSVLDHESVDPEKVREYNRDKAKEIIDDSPRFKIVVLGHTHFRDLQPNSGESSWATANSGTWLREIQAGKDSKGCSLSTKPSPLPYVKISKEEGEDKALVELKFYRGNLRHRTVRVLL
jgi:UDP-2,3-diacylglucosamine pyrophosphatase LpxH